MLGVTSRRETTGTEELPRTGNPGLDTWTKSVHSQTQADALIPRTPPTAEKYKVTVNRQDEAARVQSNFTHTI